ncbi:SpoIID/LytB domain-containing protein [Leptolyngbya sp. FACHB-321]|uniref:SpoIID/LytB domain-containing protein n=1 Tax=Leptolyngbya sp. FACHB-321 TaxID=2692807 RepID=UPI001F54C311|nr:SpoIID/LytB domain-containing protein [Leptolyngbya sp. FACHB-321]
MRIECVAQDQNAQDQLYRQRATVAVKALLRQPSLGVVLAIASMFGLGLGLAAPGTAATRKDVELQIGVVQRFGSKATDGLMLQAATGDRLTFRFETKGKAQTVTATSAKLDVVQQTLPEPNLQERVVLSTHRSFESAEASAKRWLAQGIPVEVAQPERWQVWAKRDTYSNPLLRRLLLQSLQAQGMQTAYIDTQVLPQQPRASLVVNGYRYTRDRVEIGSSQGTIQVLQTSGDKKRTLYAGSLRLQPNTYGTYTLVNQVPLETYLRGVVPHEIGAWAVQPVLEVQAILARTYALRNVRRFAIDGYQLCADTQCQVYNGLTGAHPATDRAIAATRGTVLTYKNELVDAVYSSSTGGITAPFTDIWAGADRPYLRAVIDSVGQPWDLARQNLAEEKNFRRFISQTKGFNEAGANLFRWRVESRLEDLNRDIRRYLVASKDPLANFKTIQRLEVTKRSPAGRVLNVRITTDRGTFELVKDNILVALYAPNSTLFYVEPLYGANKTLQGYSFVGGGFGHGVGLSQTGTYHLGKLGWSSDRILSFYYPGTQLRPISDAITFWRGDQNNGS